jgi:glutamate-1-semialdehyde aminotransferase
MTSIHDELVALTPGSAAALEESGEVLAQEVVDTVVIGHPVYIREARGSKVIDVDGNEYVDLAMGWGTQLLGHAPQSLSTRLKRRSTGACNGAGTTPTRRHWRA